MQRADLFPLWATGAKLPLYTFGRRQSLEPTRTTAFEDDHLVPNDLDLVDGQDFSDSEPENYFLDNLLLAQVQTPVHSK